MPVRHCTCFGKFKLTVQAAGTGTYCGCSSTPRSMSKFLSLGKTISFFKSPNVNLNEAISNISISINLF